MKYTSIEDLGRHSYEGDGRENNALLYTACAGYIDMGHLRESADRARYIFQVIYNNLLTGETEFAFTVVEPAEYHIRIVYPAYWKRLGAAEQVRISRETAIELGQNYAHKSTIWHEIVSWYGYASTGFFSEKVSSFSWEDGYSDLLGTKIAAMAMRDETKEYNEAVTELIIRELKKLDPQPAEIAEEATDLIKGKWYSGKYPLISMNKRNFDVGFGGYIKPFRVPGICRNAREVVCSVPLVTAPKRYGFDVTLRIIPQESERRQILKIVHRTRKENTLNPDEDFPKIVRHIRSVAIKQVGPDVDKPTL